MAFRRKSKSARGLREARIGSISRQPPHHEIDLADLRDTARAQKCGVWEGRGAEISAMESFYRLASDIGRETLVGRVIMRSVFASFRLMGTTPSCRRHAERATPREPTRGEKLALVLIQRIGWFGGRWLDERGDFY